MYRSAWLIIILNAAAVAMAQQGIAPERPLRVSASWSTLVLGRSLTDEVATRNGLLDAHCQPTEGARAWSRVLRRQADVAVVLESELSQRLSASEDLLVLPVGTYVVGVIANSRNGIRALSLAEIASVLREDVTGRRHHPQSRITAEVAFHCPTVASTEWMMFERAAGISPLRFSGVACADGGWVHQHGSMTAVMQAVAADAHGMGVVLLSPNWRFNDRVVVLELAGSAEAGYRLPTPEAIAEGTYPLMDRALLLCTEQSSKVAATFLGCATGPEGVEIIKRHGLWPEYELEKVRGEQRVADVKAGKGEPVAVCDLAGVSETLKAAALEFARAKMAVQVTLDSGGGSAEAAVAKLKTGEAELLVVDGGMGEEWRGQGTEEGGAEMVLGSRAVGVVVHPGNSFNELTMDDLRQILAGKVDRWPGATGTAERIVLYTLPLANPLMPLVDRAMGADLKRAKVTVRPDSQRVMLSVAAQPGSLGLVDLTKIARHETKVKLLAILPPGETEAATAALDRVPEAYPLASPVALHLSPKASEAARSFFAFLNEGGGRDALLAGGLIPRPLPEAIEAEVAAAYGMTDGPADEPQATGPSAQVAEVEEDDAPATASPDHLHDVLRGAMGGPQEASPADVVPAGAPAGTERTVESEAADSTPLDPDRPAPPPRQAEETEAIQPAPVEGSVPHGAASEPPADEASFAAWLIAHAVPIGLVGLGITAVAVALGSLGMKRARHRSEVMRRYRP